MKKKSNGQNFEIIKNHLKEKGVAYASQIQKATKIKGNIYTMLQSMVNRKIVKKIGRLYSLTAETPTQHKIDMIPKPTPQPNPYANILKREHEHIMQGIQQLQITANYLALRIKEFERATSET